MTEDHATNVTHIVEGVHRSLNTRFSGEELLRQLAPQLDTYSRTYKNKYIMSHVDYQVAVLVFNIVKVVFLPFDPAQEDVDQCLIQIFGRVRHHAAKHAEKSPL